jgi:hypothetical protein
MPLPDYAWGEGASATTAGVSGSGTGAPAAAGDATWFHTSYDPAAHPDQPFDPERPGYWPALGVLGDGPYDAELHLGQPFGWAPAEIGELVFSDARLEQHVDAWLAGAPNQGWLVLGDETLDGDNQSSARGFASREHADVEFQPVLQFETRAVPEPGSVLILGALSAWLVFETRRRRS